MADAAKSGNKQAGTGEKIRRKLEDEITQLDRELVGDDLPVEEATMKVATAEICLGDDDPMIAQGARRLSRIVHVKIRDF